MTKRVRPVGAEFYVSSPFGPRWGTQHRGTDFGRAGGSGGQPVYAAQGGSVVYCGAASGFGGPDPAGWVVIDHPTADGSGTTVYGHVVRDSHIRVGARVEAGQRIGIINPNSATNGGVAPHLHFEVHPTVWKQGSQIDPIAWLGNAPAPNAAKAPAKNTAPATPVIYGVDLSEHQKGISLAKIKAEGFQFAILRLCDGTYVDKQFGGFLKAAESAGLLVSTYWYLRAPSEGTTIKQQVDVIDRQMGGRRDLGVWIDVESVDRSGRKLLTAADVKEAKRELESRGYHVPGIYSGAWYWEKMPGGEPSMAGLGHLWVSHYGRNRSGFASVLYAEDGGNNHPGWAYPLGDRKPDILQFGSRGRVAGFAEVDVNAFRGTRAQLSTIFNGAKKSTPTTPTKKPEVKAVEEIRIPSLVNDSKAFAFPHAIGLIDATAWETRILMYALFDSLGLDPAATIAAAKDADAAGKSPFVPAVKKG